MSVTDWEFFAKHNGAALTDFGEGGVATHTLGELSVNPLRTPPDLSHDGYFARQLEVTGDAGTGTRYLFMAAVDSGVSGGDYVSVPSTRAVSVQAWLRHQSSTTSTFGDDIGVYVKGNPENLSTSGVETLEVSGIIEFEGYSLSLGSGIRYQDGYSLPTSIDLVLAASSTDNVTTTDFVVCSAPPYDGTGYKQDRHHFVRLDVIPLGGGSADRLNAYVAEDIGTGSPGYANVPVISQADWTLVGSMDIQSTDTNFAPWGGATRRVGYYCESARDASATSSMYIDSFRALLEDV